MTKKPQMTNNQGHPIRLRHWRFVIHSSFIIWVSSFLALVPSSLPAAELHWRHGEAVGGDFLAAEKDRLAWRAPQFSEPIRVRLDVLKQVVRHKEPENTVEPFSIRLADGSRLYGSITGLDAKTLELKSARSGTLRIARDAVVDVRRLKADGMLFAAPTSTSGWIEGNQTGQDSKVKLWRVVPGAALKQVGWNRSATLPFEAPELVEMQFTLSSTVRPEFKVELKAKDNERMLVETWVDDVVLQGRVFQSVKTLSEDDRRVTMTVFWNRKTGLCAIYDADGRKLAETSKPPVEEKKSSEAEKAEKKQPAAKGGGGGGLFGALLGVVQGAAQARVEAVVQVQRSSQSAEPASPVGFTLLNKGPDLTLEGLRIRAWNGTLPQKITSDSPRVELMDGRVIAAAAVRASATTLSVRDGKGGETTLPWEQVLAVEMAATPSPFFENAATDVELWFTDGEWLKGVLQHVRNDTATLTTAWSEQPVAFKITRMHHLEFKQPGKEMTEADLAALDVLTIDKKVLHGTLAAGGEAQPRWKPVGGLQPVALAKAGEMGIVRAPSANPAGLRSEALFYLSSGDILPGKLRAIDSRQVDLDSAVVPVKQLPAEKIHAIQFGGESLNLDGFEDSGWKRVRGGETTVKRNGKAALDFLPGGSWGHPSFMQANEISFNLLSDGFTALRVRLFCDGVNPAAPSTNLLFGHMGSEVCFGLEASGDQMDRQFRLRSSGPMPVRIAIGDTSVEVYLNGVSARKITLDPKMRSGSGMIIEPFSLWGNGERDAKINSFSARIAPGRVAVPNVEAKAKEHALTVPRFRKEDPPKHALLAANGDVLRGVIEAATAAHFSVRSGLETIQVPRDRVKAAVWLIKPADDVSAAFEARAKEGQAPVMTHWLLLNNGGRLGLKVERFAEDAVTGQNEMLGACHVPLNEVHLIRSTAPPENAAMLALRDWKLKFAPEPVLPEAGGESSPLLNQPAKTFKLPLLAGGDFDLAQEKGKVVVLDFWATWCGPCVKSLPDMIDQMSAFDPKKVRFIGVNQAEAKEQVKTFLETRGWKMEVALDANQRVGQSFGVEGIPHTVIIGPDGKVAFVKTGYEPDGAKKIAETVRKLLEK
ncbi:TlpA family protein disulfide reductase [Prosthecobacter sp.]|uniref:TlpA family protein disulfide reductase n=1 Tax=Prosthecobacter sp. TaxID=1965333 RepID=UPI003782E93A